MASSFTIPQIINFSKISQYLAANEKASLLQLKGGSLINSLPGLLYMEGTLLQNMYSLNPTGLTLRGAAEYVLSLCGKYLTQAQTILNNLAGSLPVITGPANQNVLVGVTATFSVSVVSATAVHFQWYLNGIVIPGAINSSYQVVNAQLVQSGGLYSVAATNAAGTVTSNQAVLTVSPALVVGTAYMDTDPGPNLQANIDNFTYQISTNITHNQPITITIPQAATPNKYFVHKVPVAESIKTTWFNTALNNGNIPDAIYQNYIQFGGFTYYYTRVADSLDYTATLILS